MAEQSFYNLSYADWAKRVDPSGKIDAIVELLNKYNPITEDAIVLEANQPTSHRTTIRTGLPQGTWRMLYQGVQPTASRTAQVTDTIGMLEAYSEIDKSLADLNGNTAAFRMSEASAFIEGMTQQFVQTLFYGASTDLAQFVGFANRYNATPASTDPESIAYNIVDGGGSATLTSMYFIQWGSDCAHLIFPKGGSAGLSHQDLGEQTLSDSQTPAGRYQGYRDHWKWDVGLTLRDWKSCARLANINTAKLGESDGPDLVNLMIKTFYRIPNPNKGKMAIYCNRTVATWLHIQAAQGGTGIIPAYNSTAVQPKRNVALSLDTYAGRSITTFLGIPIRVCDGIKNSETQVS